MYCYVRFLSKLWCCSFTLVRGRLVIPIYYFPTCSCCKGTHSPPNQIWLPKQEKSVKGKRGEKCSPNRMHVCWKYCRSSYSEALIPKNTSYVQVGFHTQVLYCTLGLACIEFWVTCTIKIVYLWSYCYTSCVLLKENWKKKQFSCFFSDYCVSMQILHDSEDQRRFYDALSEPSDPHPPVVDIRLKANFNFT